MSVPTRSSIFISHGHGNPAAAGGLMATANIGTIRGEFA